jgi:hypothetical protein
MEGSFKKSQCGSIQPGSRPKSKDTQKLNDIIQKNNINAISGSISGPFSMKQ